MTGRGTFLLLTGVAIVGAGLAFAAGGDLGLAVPAALAATVAAAVALALSLTDRLRWPPRPVVPLDVDPSIALRDALRGGAFARTAVIAHLRSLEKRFPEAVAPIGPEEEERVIALTRGQFLRWVEARVAALEAAT